MYQFATLKASSTIDQRGNIRDGRWQRMLSSVPLQAKTSYEVAISWDPTRSGYVAVRVLVVGVHFMLEDDIIEFHACAPLEAQPCL
jgi:hypothetical protein